MNHVRAQPLREMEQPVSGPAHVGPTIGHPLEFVIAFEQTEIRNLFRFCALCGRERRSHQRQLDLDVVRLQRARELESVGPNATYRVPCHENFSRFGH
jgi:hypothetical protein